MKDRGQDGFLRDVPSDLLVFEGFKGPTGLEVQSRPRRDWTPVEPFWKVSWTLERHLQLLAECGRIETPAGQHRPHSILSVLRFEGPNTGRFHHF